MMKDEYVQTVALPKGIDLNTYFGSSYEKSTQTIILNLPKFTQTDGYYYSQNYDDVDLNNQSNYMTPKNEKLDTIQTPRKKLLLIDPNEKNDLNQNSNKDPIRKQPGKSSFIEKNIKEVKKLNEIKNKNKVKNNQTSQDLNSTAQSQQNPSENPFQDILNEFETKKQSLFRKVLPNQNILKPENILQQIDEKFSPEYISKYNRNVKVQTQKKSNQIELNFDPNTNELPNHQKPHQRSTSWSSKTKKNKNKPQDKTFGFKYQKDFVPQNIFGSLPMNAPNDSKILKNPHQHYQEQFNKSNNKNLEPIQEISSATTPKHIDNHNQSAFQTTQPPNYHSNQTNSNTGHHIIDHYADIDNEFSDTSAFLTSIKSEKAKINNSYQDKKPSTANGQRHKRLVTEVVYSRLWSDVDERLDRRMIKNFESNKKRSAEWEQQMLANLENWVGQGNLTEDDEGHIYLNVKLPDKDMKEIRAYYLENKLMVEVIDLLQICVDITKNFIENEKQKLDNLFLQLAKKNTGQLHLYKTSTMDHTKIAREETYLVINGSPDKSMGRSKGIHKVSNKGGCFTPNEYRRIATPAH